MAGTQSTNDNNLSALLRTDLTLSDKPSKNGHYWKPWAAGIGLAIVVLASNAGLGWFITHRHEPVFAALELSDVVSAIIAGVLFSVVVRYHLQQRRAVNRRLETIAAMNHHIRNALEVIALTAHTSSDQTHVAEIRAAVDRISWALSEILPKL